MGWLINDKLEHLMNYINNLLGEVQATKANVGNDAVAVTQRNIALDQRLQGYVQHEYIEVWFLSESTKDGQPYIGLLLVDYDGDVKKNEDTSGRVYEYGGDGEWPKTSTLVQGWGYKALDCQMGFANYTCPLEYLDEAPVRGEHDEKWRAEMRQRAGSLV